MKKLDQVITDLIQREGGYVNHPADRGGPTRWGITEAVARAYGYNGDMMFLPELTARTIYIDQFWNRPNLSSVGNLSEAVAEEMLDTGVNMGPKVAAKFLQRALNVLNSEAKLYPDIAVDGDIGPMTIAALRQLIAKRGHVEATKVLLRMLNAQQSVRYIELAENKASQEAFMFGWQLHRVS